MAVQTMPTITDGRIITEQARELAQQERQSTRFEMKSKRQCVEVTLDGKKRFQAGVIDMSSVGMCLNVDPAL
jgi:hypothetical protein